MKSIFIFFLMLIFASQCSAMDIITVTSDDSFNFFFSFMFYVTLGFTPFFVVAYFFL